MMILRSNKIYKSDFIGSLTAYEIESNSHFIYQGLHYGYPICCITYFIKNCVGGRAREVISKRKYIKEIDSKGYIPCCACHCKLVSGVNIHKLLLYRKHSKPFPNGR